MTLSFRLCLDKRVGLEQLVSHIYIFFCCWILKSNLSIKRKLHGGSGGINMNASLFTKPAKLEFEGNVAENYRRFRQQFEIYMSVTGLNATSVPKKKQAAILLNIAGEEAIEVFNTFTFAEDNDKDDPEAILAKFQNYCEPKKNITYERHIFNTRVQQVSQ